MQLVEFLQEVWGRQPKGHGFLGWRKPQGWSFVSAGSHRVEKLRINNLRDLYFTPNVFSEERRQKRFVMSSCWLYADLDEVNPETLKWLPTLWWETSHGKYQGLWRMTKRLSPEWHATVNQKLTYLVNADRGGWGASKVLRVPGSISTKHGGEYHILAAEHDEDLVYDPRELWQTLRDIPTAVVQSGKINFEETAKAAELMGKVPPQARALLRRRKAGDRSDHVYLTVAELAETGRFSPSEVLTLMLTSPIAQEKYGARIREEIERAISKCGFPAPGKKKAHRKVNGRDNGGMQSLYKFMGQDFRPPQWLIKGVWSEDSRGFIAGDPKTYKSTIAVDLAVSIATGKKFLGHFPVMRESRGPVLYVDEENLAGLTQARFSQVLSFKRLQRPGYLPDSKVKDVHLMSRGGFRLTSEEDVTMLQKYVKKYRIKLVILDPLYYVAQGIDENSPEMKDLLVELGRLADHMKTSLMIVHHFRKDSRENPENPDNFQRMSGTGGMGRWFESLMMLTRAGDGVRIHTEHRMARGMRFDLEFEMKGVDDKRYHPMVTVPEEEEQDQRTIMKNLMRDNNGVVTLPQAMRRLGVTSRQTANRRLLKWGYYVDGQGHGKPSLVKFAP